MEVSVGGSHLAEHAGGPKHLSNWQNFNSESLGNRLKASLESAIAVSGRKVGRNGKTYV